MYVYLWLGTQTLIANAEAIHWSMLFAGKCVGWHLVAKEILSNNITLSVHLCTGIVHTR